MPKLHGKTGLILAAAGELSADRYGLYTGRCQFKFPPGEWSLLPGGGAVHPHAPWAVSEKQTVLFTPGFWTLNVEYAGTPIEVSPPVYESRRGTGQEAIQTNPRFVSHIAGKPSAPLNGAIFLDPNGDVTTDDVLGTFDKFKLIVDGKRNELFGLNAYLAVNNTIWSKSWTQRSKPSQDNVGKIATPSGPYPNYGAGSNWLDLGVDYTQRANVYACHQQWMGSGPGGFSTIVYASA